MRTFAVPFALMILGVGLAAPFSAMADEPLAPYEGRPLPVQLKQLLWARSCDVPQAEAEGDQCVGDLCRFTRSNGTAFKPMNAPWMNLTMFQWAVGPNALQPAIVETKLAREDELDGDVKSMVALVSGLAVDVKTDDWLVQLNPLLVRWALREVLPPADQAMCGRTAKEVFLASYAGATRMMVDVYAQLKQRGALRATKQKEVEQSFEQRRGRFTSACDAISKKTKNQDEIYARHGACWWWLRRAATTGTDELALLFGSALKRYDAEGYKTFAGALPKELKDALP